MKIAVITETFYPFRGGSAKRYYEVLKRLVKKGYEIDLYTVRLNKEWTTYENIDGINVYRTEKLLSNFITKDGFRSISQVLFYSAWVMKKSSNEDYQIIESNHCPIFPVMSSWIRTKISKVPLSVTFHEVWYSQWYWYSPTTIHVPLGIILEKIYVKMPDIAIAVSNTTASRLVSLLKMDRNKVVTIPNGVDLELFNSIKTEKMHNKIIYVGRLNWHKKIDRLIDAIPIIKRYINDIHLEIVGDGPMKAEYEEYIRKKNLQNCVTILGAVDDKELVKRLKSAYIYVLPSIREGQSITTLEAMAAGTPQIVVDVDGNGASALIKESKSGLTVGPSSYKIAEAVLKIMNDKKLWLKLQQNGYEFIKKYDWNTIAEEHDKVYKNLI
ncbi:MAG: glycosyltransferase family 4 protein [Thermoprotei archaeon]